MFTVMEYVALCAFFVDSFFERESPLISPTPDHADTAGLIQIREEPTEEHNKTTINLEI